MPSVGGDIAFSLGRLGLSTGEIVRRVDDALRTVGLEACSSPPLGPSIDTSAHLRQRLLTCFRCAGLRPAPCAHSQWGAAAASRHRRRPGGNATGEHRATRNALLLPPARCVTAAILRTRASRCCC